ncbi:hypothetical protein RhiirA1_461627 [Rhizophagus irregularis]|uniref:Uncharacterized protein n=1 Tax=Rhizophagus irregularis TaxID=588596 RepID=A0A2N0RNY6_9GLOM|nr:hypothetical protein RhiirA1_461627 [Rhizophagus irregularis]
MATLKKADPDPHKPEVACTCIEDKISVNASEFKHIASSEGYGNAQSEVGIGIDFTIIEFIEN